MPPGAENAEGDGNANEETNLNGSRRNIAGIFNDMLYVYKILLYQDDVVNTAKSFLEHFDTQQAIYDRLGLSNLAGTAEHPIVISGRGPSDRAAA